MALAIKHTPTLKGKSAKKFLTQIAKNERNRHTIDLSEQAEKVWKFLDKSKF